MHLRLRDVHSLKEKRAVVRPIIEGTQRRFAVAAAEVAHQDSLREAVIGLAAVSGDAGFAVTVLDKAERFVWSFPEVEVLSAERSWLEA